LVEHQLARVACRLLLESMFVLAAHRHLELVVVVVVVV